MNETPIPAVKPWRFSATAAEMWTSCPYAFSCKYERGVGEIAGRPLLVGRLLATTVERYQLHCFENRVPSDVVEIQAIARAAYAEQGQGIPLDVLDEVLRVCEYYVESFNLDLERIAGVEMWLPPTGVEPMRLAGRDVVGKVDQLLFDDEGRTAIVVDQKSNWAVWSEDEAREKLQSRLYPVLIFHSFPDVEEVEVRFQFIRWGIERSVHFTRAEAYLEKEKLEALSRQMQRPGPRVATPGAMCAYCAYVSSCPIFRAARQNGIFILPTNEAEAKKVVETMLVLDSGLKQRRAALRAYTAEHGPVNTNGIEFGHFRTDTRRVLTKRFMDWANENGVRPEEWLVVPATELKKLLKKKKSLEPITHVESDTDFKQRKHGHEAEEETAV